MKVDLKVKYSLIGYSKLFGVDHTRIKARSRKPDTSTHSYATDAIRKEAGCYYKEYRLVEEEEGFIFREVLLDTGINGHHPFTKAAIASALSYVDIYIDEDFEHEHLPEFKELEVYHMARNKGCKHEYVYYRHGVEHCSDCGRYGSTVERISNPK